MRPDKGQPAARAAFAAAVAVALLGGVAACGSKSKTSNADGKDQRVPSLSGTAASSAANPTGGEGPLIRPDTSQEETDRLYNVYQECLFSNGLDRKTWKLQKEQNLPVWTAAQKVCGSKEPEAWFVRAQRTDPHYADKLHIWVNCAREHGIKAHESAEGHLMLEDGLPSGDKEKAFKECEQKAFNS